MGHLQGTLELIFFEIFRKVMYAYINLYILFFCWAEHVYSGPVLAVGHPFILFFSAELSTLRPTQVSDSNWPGHTLMIYRLNWTRRGSPVLSVGHPFIFFIFSSWIEHIYWSLRLRLSWEYTGDPLWTSCSWMCWVLLPESWLCGIHVAGIEPLHLWSEAKLWSVHL